MPTLYIQERANKGVCKPKADSEVRAIPPDGLNEFSLGQCCLEREKLAGERCSPLQIFVFKKGNGAMWASPPTNPPVSYADIPAQGTPFGCPVRGAYITRSIHHLLSHLPANRQKKSLCVYRGIFYCNTIFLKRQHKTDPVFVFRFHLYPYFMGVGDALGDGQPQTVAAGRSGT